MRMGMIPGCTASAAAVSLLWILRFQGVFTPAEEPRSGRVSHSPSAKWSPGDEQASNVVLNAPSPAMVGEQALASVPAEWPSSHDAHRSEPAVQGQAVSERIGPGGLQIIALDCGLLQGPSNSLKAASRALRQGADALNLDVVLTPRGRLVAAHNASHWLPLPDFPTIPQNLSHFEEIRSPPCQHFKHAYLLAGFESFDLEALEHCPPQPLSVVEDFLTEFPQLPITLDLKSSSLDEQLRSLAVLDQILETAYPQRAARPELTTVRFFSQPATVLKAFPGGTWRWPRFRLALGIPAEDGRTDALEALKHLESLPQPAEALKAVAAVYITPRQLEDAQGARARGLRLVCDLGQEELRSLSMHNLSEVLPECVSSGAVAVHTGRLAAAAGRLMKPSSAATRVSRTSELPQLSKPGAKLTLSVISQSSSGEPLQIWQSGGSLWETSWTRCTGKLATSLLVLRLVGLGLLPGLDQPIVKFLQLKGRWMNWKEHPVMQTLTLRHVMSGVGGLSKWKWLPDWATQSVRPASELAERALAEVNRSFVPGQVFIYSNLQWAVVELAVERATGMDLPKAARRFLFEPLGISEGTYYRSEDRPACPQVPESSVYERNLRAGIGLCATAYDLFLLGLTLRQSCKQCLLSEAGFLEVMTDQLAVHFPQALPSFLHGPPATDFANNGLALAGRGFAGYHLSGGWMLAHGGAEGYFGQNILVQTNGTAVLVTWISHKGTSPLLQHLAKASLVRFAQAPSLFNASYEAARGPGKDVPSARKSSARLRSTATLPVHSRPPVASVVSRRPRSKLEVCAAGVRSRQQAPECRLPLPARSEPEDLGNAAEHLYACQGLKATTNATTEDAVPIGRQGSRCAEPEFHGKLRRPNDMPKFREACLAKWNATSTSDRKVCAKMSACSSAWNLQNRFQWNKFNENLNAIVRMQHELFLHYVATGAADGLVLDEPSCLEFPLPRRLCGGMAAYHDHVALLEPLYPDLRNMWHHEHAEVIDFTPYLPLPAISSDAALSAKRRILLVVGANKFGRAPKYLMDMYRPYITFDEVLLFDAHAVAVPPAFNNSRTRLMFREGKLQIGTRDESDLIHLLPSLVREEDFVVLMWDTDLTTTVTLEWGFLADLISQNHSLVDELYIELHFRYQGFNDNITTWLFDRHTRQEAFEILYQMRHTCGFAVHAWP